MLNGVPTQRCLPCCCCRLLHKRLGAGDKPHTSTGISCPQAPCNPLQQVPQLRSPKDVMAIGKNILGSMLYTYFNWRQDTSRDLLVTFLVFACMLLAGGGVRRYVVDDAADLAVGNLWADVYQVRLAQPCAVLMLS